MKLSQATPTTDQEPAPSWTMDGRRGAALVLVLIMSSALVLLAFVTLSTARGEVLSSKLSWDKFEAEKNAMAAISDAMTRLRTGETTPESETATQSGPRWVPMGGNGHYYYSTTFDPATSVYRVRAFGRVQTDRGAAPQMTTGPEDAAFDRAGWLIKGYEVVVIGTKRIPSTPLYFGNGGVEKTRGGWKWNSSVDPNDPSTWPSSGYYGINGNSPSGVQSYISPALPFEVSSLRHPQDYLDPTGGYFAFPRAGVGDLGGPTAPTVAYEHGIFASQTHVGRHNAESYFGEWTTGGGSLVDPASRIVPNIDDNTIYPDIVDDGNTYSSAFPIDDTLPDVQTWAWDLWARHKNDPKTVHLMAGNSVNLITSPDGTTTESAAYVKDSGTQTLTIGSPSDPRIVFTTGRLTVPSGWNVKVYGVLVSRDDYHPDEGGDNRPTGIDNEGEIDINGRLEVSGLVMVTGWRPSLDLKSNGAELVVLGALFGEDSVQSGGEPALDAAQIQLYLGSSKSATGDAKRMEVFYSREIFAPGGRLHDLLPEAERTVAGITEIK